jgi:hypothetical protein
MTPTGARSDVLGLPPTFGETHPNGKSRQAAQLCSANGTFRSDARHAPNRQQLANQLRSLLREYFPAALKAFHVKNIGLTSREARAVLQAAPSY